MSSNHDEDEGKEEHDGDSNSVDSSNICLVPSLDDAVDKDGVSLSSASSLSSSESATGAVDHCVVVGDGGSNRNTNKNDTVEVTFPNLGEKNTFDRNVLLSSSPDTPLYKSMIQLTLTTRDNEEVDDGDDHCQHRICTPSAAKAEELSTKLLHQVNDLVIKEGNSQQRKQWNDATIEQQNEWIASFFFLSSISTANATSTGSTINDDTNDGVGSDNDNNEDQNDNASDNDSASDSSDDWGKEELVFPPTTAATGAAPDETNNQLSDDDDDGDEYWASTIETLNNTDVQKKTNNVVDPSKKSAEQPSSSTTDQHDQQQQEDLFLVDMTRIDSSIHCKFDKNGVNDVSSMRRLRRTIEDDYETYKSNTTLLADATIVPCSIGVWQPALIRLREERPGQYICPIFRPKK